MTLILFVIFAIAIFGVMIILSAVRGVASFLCGKSNTYSGYGNMNGSRKNQYNDYSNRTYKKVFSKDEGEYVKFEEIKE